MIKGRVAIGKSSGHKSRAYIFFDGIYYFYSVSSKSRNPDDMLIKSCTSAAQAFAEVQELNNEVRRRNEPLFKTD